jgi:hypothetical protein
LALMVAGCGHGGGHRGSAEEDLLNVQAKLPAGMPVPAMDWRVIASSVDRVHSTMSTLTGNDMAVKYSGTDTYPVGSQLALMTWLQRDDPHWFGARVPGSFAGLETVTVERGADGKSSGVYRRYTGDPMREVVNSSGVEARKSAILGMRASVMP